MVAEAYLFFVSAEFGSLALRHGHTLGSRLALLPVWLFYVLLRRMRGLNCVQVGLFLIFSCCHCLLEDIRILDFIYNRSVRSSAQLDGVSGVLV